MSNQKENKPQIHIGVIGVVGCSRTTLSEAIDRFLSPQSKTLSKAPPTANDKYINKKGE